MGGYLHRSPGVWSAPPNRIFRFPEERWLPIIQWLWFLGRRFLHKFNWKWTK